MYRLIETMRIVDGQINNFEAHRERINESSRKLFGTEPHWNLDVIFSRFPIPRSGFHKLRMVYDQSNINFNVDTYTIKPVRTLKVVVNDTIQYDHKFEDRKELEQMLQMCDLCDDILIIKNGLVTDVSYANIVFRRGDRWITPQSYLLNGTMRQLLLKTQRITEEPITIDDLGRFTEFKLINAMLAEDSEPSNVSNIR